MTSINSNGPAGGTTLATSTRGSVSRPTYEVKVDSPVPGELYQIKHDKTGRYYGFSRSFPPPAAAWAALDEDLMDRILVDLGESKKRLIAEGSNMVRDSASSSSSSIKDSLDIAVEMSGFMVDGSITLYPGLRIICNKKKHPHFTETVNTVVALWLPQDTIFKYIRVVLPTPTGAKEGKVANDADLSPTGLEPSTLPDGLEVQFEVGCLVKATSHDSLSSSTFICRTSLYRNGERTATRYSRVSGPLLIHKHRVHVTTAHQILDMIDSTPADASSQPSVSSDGASVAEQDVVLADPAFLCPTRPSVDFAAEVKDWKNITPPCRARYGRLEIRPRSSSLERSQLVLAEKPYGASLDCVVLQSVREPDPPSTGLRPTELCGPEDPEESVRILLDGPNEEQSLRGLTCVRVRGAASARRETSTILLSLDVALPPGSSGASVEKNGSFVGMIVASYQGEPMAHMVGAKRIAAYIGHVLDDQSTDTAQPESFDGLGDNSLQRLQRGLLRLPGGRQQNRMPLNLSTDSESVPVPWNRTLHWRETLSSDNSQDVRAALESREISQMALTESPLPSPLLRLGFSRQGSDMSRRSRPVSTASPANVGDEMMLSHTGAHLSEMNMAESRCSNDGGSLLLGREATHDGGTHSSSLDRVSFVSLTRLRDRVSKFQFRRNSRE